ncbi:unnamed protein product [Polarella glacialis]|uniref:Fatty acid desaturase domain-containing protein n=1 Tax=Polarella glacialis TaxID=89957 RepID=A0A813KY50_POLGL|nr:unnamed protein product [Polarella glacialis]
MENMLPSTSKAEGVQVTFGEGETKVVAPPPLKPREVRQKGLLETSDLEGFSQLFFHFGCLAICGLAVHKCFEQGRWGLLLLAEIPLGVVLSFLFNGFHEMVHNTAFASQWLNTIGAQVLGFVTFRGAKWFWCFHWTHHRFTNDPVKDPELSGGSLDLDDPTRTMLGYFQFLSGYPFGFERVGRMVKLALGSAAADPWVADKPEATQRFVRMEASVYSIGYLLIAVAALAYPSSVGLPVVLYWLLPHALGAGHLRMYQFAEHRACTTGSYTDTNAWVCARTTATWWVYRKLAWQMPFHVEHHAYPNVPFHKLEEAHAVVKASYITQGIKSAPSGCNPDGSLGYIGLQKVIFMRMLGNVAAAKAAKAA